jgi:hypothetical protein
LAQLYGEPVSVAIFLGESRLSLTPIPKKYELKPPCLHAVDEGARKNMGIVVVEEFAVVESQCMAL